MRNSPIAVVSKSGEAHNGTVMRRNIAAVAATLVLAGVCPAHGQMRYGAKLVLEDGTPPPESVLITTGRTERLLPACQVSMFGSGTIVYVVDWRSLPDDPTGPKDECPVTIRLAGYRRIDVTLRDGAVVVLKRTGDHEGSSTSVTALRAPADARRAYERGVKAMSQSKWNGAQKEFDRAVAIYPDYALAWSELGEALRQQTKLKEAVAACERALQIDPKCLKPYQQLARLALAENRPEDAVHLTERAMELNPVEFPGIYFYHAVANYNLKRFDPAEKSARRALLSTPIARSR